MDTLRFWPLESKVDAATFWSALGEHKLHTLKLEEGPLPLRATWAPSSHSSQSGVLTVSASSLPQPGSSSGAGSSGGAGQLEPGGGVSRGRGGGFEVLGDLYVLNTAERILKVDRKAAVQQACDRVWAAICSGAAERDPCLLQTAVLLTYCDLKQYKYRYWFAFPALQPLQPFALAAPPDSLAAALGSEAAAAAVAAACSEHMASSGMPAWLVCVGNGGSSSSGDSGGGGAVEVLTAPLTDWTCLQQEQQHEEEQQEEEQQQEHGGGSGGAQRCVYLAVADSSNLPENPGWPLRNLLLMAAARWGCRTLPVLCLRQRRGRCDAAASLALEVALPQLPPGFSPPPLGGWEPNERGKAGPRTADLAPAMDPRQLAEAAVELNLRLMRWRAAPTLDVGCIGAARCLLLGAGTLGCSVARTLLGWGVRHITFVDNSRVAYSNPVRQSLFNFEDCLGGGKPKAAAAAEAVTRIFPGVSARGVQLSVPMPGHPISEVEVPQVLRDIAELEALVDAHHVTFLLMDTRESRWLPTLLCAARSRLAINAALGFSGFMVMRHGAPVPPDSEAAEGEAAEAEAGTDVPVLSEGEAAGAAGAEAVEEVQRQQQEGGLPRGGETAAGSGEAAGQPAGSEQVAAGSEGGGLLGDAAGGSAATQAAGAQPPAGVHQQGAAEVQCPQGAGEPQQREPQQQCQQAEPPGAAAPARASPRPAPPRLGCYFCNDVVAPLNSTLDRSLDQQCTVARPGLSSIAGSLAVELMAAVLAHPLGTAAPAPGGSGGAAGAGAGVEELPLGEPPHQIRGQLGRFSQMCLVGQAFRQCTACSPLVVGEYRRRGAEFVMQGLLDPKRLEDLTGLTELHQASEAVLEAWASSDDDEEEGAAGEEQQGGGKAGRTAGHAGGSSQGGAVGGDGEEDWEEL